ncbi:hypothetical protein SKAU_G00247190 [Synaphobranchus kaupii]|uniref:Uncharacterized protein n=1 Tax=Synaphobranchus kaupii TaxID=118154 RepID=A0A9Q1F241_SYNKA|nr:hypothetical protein SKAU_G00247190 [Synaphobranchus kaupii]
MLRSTALRSGGMIPSGKRTPTWPPLSVRDSGLSAGREERHTAPSVPAGTVRHNGTPFPTPAHPHSRISHSSSRLAALIQQLRPWNGPTAPNKGRMGQDASACPAGMGRIEKLWLSLMTPPPSLAPAQIVRRLNRMQASYMLTCQPVYSRLKATLLTAGELALREGKRGGADTTVTQGGLAYAWA